MNILLFAGILTLLLVWNSYALSGAWKDAMMLGTWGHKLCLWFSLCQNVAAFSILIFAGAYYAGMTLAGANLSSYPSDAGEMTQKFLILSVSILTIAAHVLETLYKRLDYRAIVKAEFVNYGKIHKRLTIIRSLGNAFVNPKKLLLESIDETDNSFLKVLSVILFSALFIATSGFFIAFGLVRYFMNSKSSRIETHLRALRSGCLNKAC